MDAQDQKNPVPDGIAPDGFETPHGEFNTIRTEDGLVSTETGCYHKEIEENQLQSRSRRCPESLHEGFGALTGAGEDEIQQIEEDQDVDGE